MSMTDAAIARPTPLTEHVQVTDIQQVGDDLCVLAHVTIDPSNPILTGHYPGRPIFPGVCLIECANVTVLIAAHSCGVVPILETVPTARFRSTVLPGQTVRIQALITRSKT